MAAFNLLKTAATNVLFPDGPFVELKEVAGGFMIITADSLEQAIEVARECPGVVMPGSSVEVREIHTS